MAILEPPSLLLLLVSEAPGLVEVGVVGVVDPALFDAAPLSSVLPLWVAIAQAVTPSMPRMARVESARPADRKPRGTRAGEGVPARAAIAVLMCAVVSASGRTTDGSGKGLDRVFDGLDGGRKEKSSVAMSVTIRSIWGCPAFRYAPCSSVILS
ncbi:hypothetical protein ACRAWF_19730 [Streptomyces sp. L7]